MHVAISLFVALIVAALPAAGLFFAVRALRFVVRLLIDEWRLARNGVSTVGECAGEVAARNGVVLRIRFVDGAGQEHTFSNKLMGVAVPGSGEPVGVIYLPSRPTCARTTLRRTAVADNLSWGCLALPFLTAVSAGLAALVLSIVLDSLGG